jgi:hypothetical protein
VDDQIPTTVTIMESYGRGIGNLVLEDCRFFGKPNFAGELDQFKNDARQFNVRIPNDMADQLRALGWRVKTLLPRPEFPDDDPKSFLKVAVYFGYHKGHEGDPAYEKGPDCWILQGEEREKLTSKTVPLLDRARFDKIDMELRGWESRPDEEPGLYTAALVTFVAVMRPSLLGEKYGLR